MTSFPPRLTSESSTGLSPMGSRRTILANARSRPRTSACACSPYAARTRAELTEQLTKRGYEEDLECQSARPARRGGPDR